MITWKTIHVPKSIKFLLCPLANVQHIWNLQALGAVHWLSLLHWVLRTGIAATHTKESLQICCPVQSTWVWHRSEKCIYYCRKKKNDTSLNLPWPVVAFQQMLNLHAFELERKQWSFMLHWVSRTGTAATQAELTQICCPSQSSWLWHLSRWIVK